MTAQPQVPGRTPTLRRLRRRVPLRVRQHWRLLALCAAFLTVLTLVFGTERIRPYVTSASDSYDDQVTVNITGEKDLFDASVAHQISLTFRDADYQRMLDGYFDEGEKGYVEADLTIDGTMVPSVGIRLKGNSTLAGLTRDGQTRQRGVGEQGPGGFPGNWPGGEQGGQIPGGQAPTGEQGGDAPGGQPPTGEQGGQPSGGEQGGPAPDAGAGQRPGAEGGATGGQRPGGFGRSTLAAEKPEELPWLISFDEFVAGRRYQGHSEVAIRVAGMGGGSTVLNEAVSLSMLDAVGEPAQRYAYTSFTVNDRPTTARLVIEHPDGNFADRIGSSTGVLYKSLSTGQFTDQGDDPIEYQDDFKQITMKGSQDLQPVIDLIQWVEHASDEEFAAGLAERVDVESFARYVALQNLLLNFDDMAGPGRNYYLWYDLTSRKFSVISWDHNLTFSGSADQGPHDAGRMGGPGGGGFPGGGFPGGGEFPEGGFPGGGFPGGGQFPEGGFPGGGPGDEATQPGGQGRPGGGGPGGMSGHALKERFLASDAFTKVYEDAYRQLYQEIYGGGQALAALDQITAVLASADGYDAETAISDAERLRTLIAARTESLAGNEVIKQV